MSPKGKAKVAAKRRRVTLERTYDAPVEDVWELWTTPEGIESWWGPDGFEVKVRSLDLRPGGAMEYAMIAVAAEQRAFLQRAGMPVSTEHRITYTKIQAPHRLEYEQLADFIPDVEPYPVNALIELHPSGQGARLVLTFDAMHDERWTQLAVAGRENELTRLAKALEGR